MAHSTQNNESDEKDHGGGGDASSLSPPSLAPNGDDDDEGSRGDESEENRAKEVDGDDHGGVEGERTRSQAGGDPAAEVGGVAGGTAADRGIASSECEGAKEKEEDKGEEDVVREENSGEDDLDNGNLEEGRGNGNRTDEASERRADQIFDDATVAERNEEEDDKVQHPEVDANARMEAESTGTLEAKEEEVTATMEEDREAEKHNAVGVAGSGESVDSEKIDKEEREDGDDDNENAQEIGNEKMEAENALDRNPEIAGSEEEEEGGNDGEGNARACHKVTDERTGRIAEDAPSGGAPLSAASFKPPPPGRGCRFPSCMRYKKARSDGYCVAHYKIHGRPRDKIDESPKGVPPPGRGCIAEGCGRYRKARCNGYCVTCFRNNGGDLDDPGNNCDGDADVAGTAPVELVLEEEAMARAPAETNLFAGDVPATETFVEGVVPQLALSFQGGLSLGHDIGADLMMLTETDEMTVSSMRQQQQHQDEQQQQHQNEQQQQQRKFTLSDNPSVYVAVKTTPKTIKSGKHCNYPDCTKYKQSGCYGYCLTHVKFADPTQHQLEKHLRTLNSSAKKRTHKRYLCKWDGCERYVQSNCNGYCLTHVKLANYEEGDDENVVKVRVRLAQRLQNGFCRALLSSELRARWGFNTTGGGDVGAVEGSVGLEAVFDVETSAAGAVDGDNQPDATVSMMDGDNDANLNEDLVEMMEVDPVTSSDIGNGTHEAATVTSANEDKQNNNDNKPPQSQPPQSQPPQPSLDFEIDLTPIRKSNGSTKCKAVGCPKNSQSHSHGFCRAHHNRYLICTGKCDSWECLCGERIASFRDRCGKCHRWRGGKQGINRKEGGAAGGASSTPKNDGEPPLKRQRKPSDKVASSMWECVKCRVSNPGSKRRCGGCLAWRGASRGSGGGGEEGGRSGAARSRGGGRGGSADGRGIDSSDFAASIGAPSNAMAVGSNAGWACARCNFDNFATEVQCFMCQAMRPNWQRYKKHRPISSAEREPKGAPKGPAAEANDKDDAADFSFSAAGNGEGGYDYYGTFSDNVVCYAKISIHYDFNQAFYVNHDYSYLNGGIEGDHDDRVLGGDGRSAMTSIGPERVESS